MLEQAEAYADIVTRFFDGNTVGAAAEAALASARQ
jgi:hypothetical protein